MQIVFDKYSTNYFENFSGEITENCQIYSSKITLNEFVGIMMNVKYATGRLIINGELANNELSINRGIYVVDEFLLYEHLNVYDNLSLVLRSMKMSPVTIFRKITNLNKSLNVNLDCKIKELTEDEILKLFYAKVVLSDCHIAIVKKYYNFTKIFNEQNILKLAKMFEEKNISFLILSDRKEKLSDKFPIMKLGKSSIIRIK